MAPSINPMTHPSTQAVAHVAAFRADMASRHERCVVTMVAVELYREAFRDLLNEHENSNTAVHIGEFLFRLFLLPYGKIVY